ncbi:MAG TPA: hypothetical protein VF406_06205 [Thermodesulfobacteriota bacterium]
MRLPPVAPDRPAAVRGRRRSDRHPGPLLVLTALAVEQEALGRALRGAARLVPTAPMPFAGLVWAPPEGRVRPSILVVRTGLAGGPLGAGAAVSAIQAARPAAVLSVGFAGGLDPALAVGDVVIGDPVVDPTLRAHWWPSASLAAAISAAARRAGLPLRVGPLLSVARVRATPADKVAASADSGAIAVDMESAGVARAATEASVPFLAVRVVSDAAGDALPEEAWRLVSPDGRAPLYRALGYLARRPASLPVLVGTGIRAARAARALEALLAAFAGEAG